MFDVGFSLMFHPYMLLLMFIGAIIGIIFGALPGLTGTMGIAICLPLTYAMSGLEGMALLIGVYIGSCSGGLISAILLKIPGTLSSIATTFDGAPMAQNGQASRALGIGIFYSFIGGMIGFIVLFILAEPLADVCVKFGPIEYFSISLFALTFVASVSGKSLVKGLISATLGMMISLVGSSPVDGLARYTFGIRKLNAGFTMLAVMIGIFAVSEMLNLATKKVEPIEKSRFKVRMKGFGFTVKEFVQQSGNMIRSAAIGTGIGILPGIGGSASNLLAYIVAKNSSKHPEKFGTGIMDGIVAPETANNASIGGAFVPLLALGIPGDGVTAILLGALMMQGLVPGPLLFDTNPEFVYGVFAALIITNVIVILVEYFGIRVFVNILRVPRNILMPIIMVLCVVGTFGANNRIFDVGVAVAFGVVGYLLQYFGYPTTPILLGFVLGSTVELNLRRGLQLTQGSFLPFITKPISMVFLIASVLSIAFAIFKYYRRKSTDE